MAPEAISSLSAPHTISVVFLSDLFNVAHDNRDPEDHFFHTSYDQLDDKANITMMIVRHHNRMAGLVMDKLLQQKEIIEKMLSKPLDKVPYINGAAILGDGGVCLILDVVGILNTLYTGKPLPALEHME